MMNDYLNTDSLIHRLPAHWKLLILVAASTGLFFVQQWYWMCGAFVLVCLLYTAAKLSFSVWLTQIKTGCWFALILLIVQWLFNDWPIGVLVSVRLLTLLLLAALLTLTTPVSVLLDTLNHAFQWLKYIHINPRKVSLAVSLTLRFIPVIQQMIAEVKEAQKVRGLERSMIAIAIPVIIRTLKNADDIADALTSRGFE